MTAEEEEWEASASDEDLARMMDEAKVSRAHDIQMCLIIHFYL